VEMGKGVGVIFRELEGMGMSLFRKMPDFAIDVAS